MSGSRNRPRGPAGQVRGRSALFPAKASALGHARQAASHLPECLVPMRQADPAPSPTALERAFLAAPCHLVGLVPRHILGELAE
jgi:hypothetical protein